MVHSNLAVFSRQKLKDFVPEIDARIAEYFDEEIKGDLDLTAGRRN